MPYTPSTPTMSLIQQPQSLSPVNAPLWYVTSLQNNSFINFKNVFTLYSYDRFSGTSSFLGQYSIPPRPDNFLGVFDAHKILQSQVGSYTFSWDQSGLQGVIDDNSVVKYKAFYGYVYNPNYIFDNTFSYNTVSTNFLGLDFNNYSPNLLQPNDIINVYMDNQNQNGSYNGLTEVISPVLSPATASVTITYYGVTPSSPETGTINSLQRLIGSSSYSYAFPGTRQYTQNNIDFGITNGISSVSSNWATNYNGVKQIFLNQYETLSLMSLTESGIANSYYQVKTYDSNWNLLNDYTSTQPTGITLSYIKYELGSGTKNLQGWNINGTPISIPTTGYYTIGLINSSSNINAIFTYSVVNNCSRYPNVRIMFQNRVGGYDYWNFNYDSKWTININRTMFTKQLDYNYNIGDRGRTILNIDANEMYSASTDWISEGDYYYLQELITSSDVFVIDEVNNYKLPINIEDTSYVQKTALRDRLFNLTINYKYSYDINLSGS